MKVYTVHRPERMGYNVYVEVGQANDGSKWFATLPNPLYSDGGPVQVAVGEEAPIYMFVPEQIAKALGEALAPRPEATERHLEDAMYTRDRMIDFVEKHIDALTRRGG